ncbi:MAG: hypothetical protein LBV72_06695 [Tannerella sp.]|jgi:hypothetical protein|nr:hypothetical protein [Tannerella sp.]
MNRLFCLLLFCGFTLSAFSQAGNCEELKKENEYLKNVLKINTPVMKGASENIEFSITRIEGNKTEQVVTITVLLNNTAPNRAFQWNGTGMKAIDLEGNVYKLNTSFTRETLYTDVPLKCEVKIQKILPKIEFVKLLSLSFYPEKSGGKSPVLEFRDLPIEWK